MSIKKFGVVRCDGARAKVTAAEWARIGATVLGAKAMRGKPTGWGLEKKNASDMTVIAAGRAQCGFT